MTFENQMMIEKILKEIDERNIVVYWEYEIPTNSIVIVAEKKIDDRLYRRVKRISSNEVEKSNMFNSHILQILEQLLKEFDLLIEKGEEI